MKKHKLDIKIVADSIVLASMIIGFYLLLVFQLLIFILSMIVYPMCCLFYYGLTKIKQGIKKHKEEKSLKIFYGLFCIAFSLYWLIVILFIPYFRSVEIIYLFAFPIIIVGIAGIVKGLIIGQYILKFRVLNSIVGMLTIFVGYLAFSLIPNIFIFHIFSLLLAILINTILRATMYLSEYNLPLRLRNLKYFFYILDDYSEIEISRRVLLAQHGFKKDLE